MLRTVKILFGLLLACLAAAPAFAFSLLGPKEVWQTSDMDYPGNFFQGWNELGGSSSKMITHEFRQDTPIITYAYDAAFLDYFGLDAVRSIDSAFAMMNSLPPVSRMSKNLTEFLTVGNFRVNQRAQELNILDMKSVTLSLLIEHMGLAGETHVFDLLHRYADTPTACYFDYTVFINNYDPITYNPSRYVNGTMYTYQIQDTCPGTPNLGSAVEQQVDKTAFPFTTVASAQSFIPGVYTIGFSRDDAGGLRYLYRRDHFNNESLADGSYPILDVATAARSGWSVPGFWATNSAAVTNAVGTNFMALRGGIEKVTFVKTHFEGWQGTNYVPLTNTFLLPIRTNATVNMQKIQRVINQPDILITAAQYEPNWFGPWHVDVDVNRSVAFVGDPAGPGIIDPQMVITFEELGPYYVNSGLGDTYYYNLNEQNSILGMLWGSYNGSTNEPIAFPNGTSIRELEIQVLGLGQ